MEGGQRPLNNMTDINADIIIVGSGVAGALCAYELSKHNISVALIEAGKQLDRQNIVNGFRQSAAFDFSSGFPNDPWAPRPDTSHGADNYLQYSQTTPLTHQGLEYLSAVGGTTWHWGGNVIRLLESDFQMNRLYGVGEDWPITYNDLEPFYAQAENEMGVSGDDDADYGSPRSTSFPMPAFPSTYGEQFIATALKDSNITFVAAPVARNSISYDGRTQCQGFSTCSPICPSGAQYNASIHVKKAVDLGCRLIDNARVNKIITNKDGLIMGVSFIDTQRQQHTARGKIIVLAANAIEIPKLLLMSANDHFPDGIANHSHQVGKNLFGHPGMSCNMLLPHPIYLGRGPEHTLLSFNHREGSFRKKRAAWYLSISNSISSHKTHLATIKGLENLALLPKDIDHFIKNQVARTVTINCMLEQLPNNSNHITLNWSKRDSGNHPTSVINWQMSGYEEAGAEQANTLLESISRTLRASDTQITFPLQHHHPMGTTRMGVSPNKSVVDANGKSHDHDNMYMISSSVFPTGGTANPTLTIAALSLRTATAIINRLKNHAYD